ncbi:mechanosensitive ion channel family protein [Spirulina sp. 06S082]|uniref:mechanosensitive ion channel family protein n=1 Tax=Spirulina sp. 06S082 TaxID=3110248 RepID=UPI002B20113F|nr:mechanosensitive ion channel domain-containing protein [Spirulina sp. 06S082]MEA5471784.1 mechanosensitive ion channel domain-containing protein [Spirulina sp. 06S082]
MSESSTLLQNKFLQPPQQSLYRAVIFPYQGRLLGIVLLSIIDLFVLYGPPRTFLKGQRFFWDLPLSLLICAGLIWVGSKLFARFFENYLVGSVAKSNRKLNSGLLIALKFIVNSAIVLVVIIAFAQTHRINIFGLLASLGVGGLAVAFAAQKTLEQILGGIVLLVDRPFVVDDYIGLPDGLFGRVESLGLRSTKIRTSGKGTIVIIPNNRLTQVNIENFTEAQKIISLLHLAFEQVIPEREKALIEQVIIESTRDILGIDPRSTRVTFKDAGENEESRKTEAQIAFFILGSGQVSIDFRRQLLDIACQNIRRQLNDYKVVFEIEDKTIEIESPITI